MISIIKPPAAKKKLTCIIVNLSTEDLPNHIGFRQWEHTDTAANARKRDKTKSLSPEVTLWSQTNSTLQYNRP